MTHLISPILTNRQRQIIAGTILGGSSLVKTTGSRNCYLSMRCKELRWLDFKASEIAILASPSPFTNDTTHRWHSMCYPVFNQLREEFYHDNKRELKSETLDLLNDVAFAIWMGDAGVFKNNILKLNVHIWGEKGADKIVKYFDSLGFVAEIFKERGSLRVKLDEASSLSFVKVAEPHLPLWYKVENYGV